MKLIIQRVVEAKVQNETKLSQIKKGLLVYVGISTDCTPEKITRAATKILNTRIFGDEFDDNFKKSVKDVGGEIILISNFTLCGDLKKGKKPNFKNSAKAEQAREFYDSLLEELKQNYTEDKIKSGFFQEYMDITSKIDGPITLVLDL